MPQPRRIDAATAVTLAHLDDAIAAGVAPLHRDLDHLRNELDNLAELVVTIADDIAALAARERRLRRWLADNLSAAGVSASAGLAIATASAVTTYLLTHL